MERRAAAGDRLAVLGGLEPAADLRGLAGSQTRGRDLRRLVLAQLEPPGQLARVELQLGERRPVRPPAVDGLGHRRAQLRRGRRTRRAGRAASARRAAAAGRAGRGSRRARRRRPPGAPRSPARRRAGRSIGRSTATSRTAISGSGIAVEQRRDPRRLRAVPDERRVGAGADREPERVDQQALAGAGLAGEDVQARARARAAAARSGRGR